MHQLQLAKFTCRLAKYVYKPSKLTRKLEPLGWNVQNFTKENAQYSVITKTNRMKTTGGENVGEPKTKTVVIFCGTNDRHDWKENIKFIRTKFGHNSPKMKVHRGFHKHYTSKIQERLLELPEINESDELYVVGHSLGGAVATMAALDLDDVNGKTNLVQNISTFGAPRTGNYGFVKYYNRKFLGRSWRIHNNMDAVPKFPWRPLYWHVGQLFYLDGKGGVHLRKKLDCRFWEAKSDHGSEKYAKELSKAIPGNAIDPFGEEIPHFN